jgi:Copper resistance protein D.
LLVEVLRRFFALVVLSIVVLLATGVPLLLQVPGAQAPAGWHLMAGLGVLMMLLFGHLWFSPWRRVRQALAAQQWAQGGQQLQQIALLVRINFALGWLAIGAVLLWR